jgi:signal transduction histidine kinase
MIQNKGVSRMNATSDEPLRRWLRELDSVLVSPATLAQRSEALAKLLRHTFPAAVLTACRLENEDAPMFSVDAAAERGAEAEELRSHACALPQRGDALVRWTGNAKMSAWDGMAAPVRHGDRVHGYLILAFGAELDAARRAALEGELLFAADALALRLELESARRRLQDWDAERREWAEQLLVGDAFSGLAHELNNSLNAILLQAALIELKAGEALKEDILAIRHEGTRAAERLAMLQRYRDRRRQASVALDLNQLLGEVLENEAGRATPVQAALGDGPLMILANPTTLKRLIQVVLWRFQPAPDAVRVSTGRHGDKLQLVVQSPSAQAPGSADETSDDERAIQDEALRSLARLVSAEQEFFPTSVSLAWKADP